MGAQSTPKLLAVVGPTAAGKSALAESLAEVLGADILSVDSMQVYKHLDVGTDKPGPQTRAAFRYSGLDLVEPDQPFDAVAFVTAADAAICEAHRAGRPVIACGGTGFYMRALIEGLSSAPGRDEPTRERLRSLRDQHGLGAMYARLQSADPTAAARIHPNDWVRVERALEVIETTGKPFSDWLPTKPATPRYNALYLGVTRPRVDLYARIDQRLEAMWKGGLLAEADRWVRGLPPHAPPARALGYQHALMALSAALTPDEALAEAQRDTRRFARRQLIWFCAMPQIHWLYAPVLPQHLAALSAAVGGWLLDPDLPWSRPESIPWVQNPRADMDEK